MASQGVLTLLETNVEPIAFELPATFIASKAARTTRSKTSEESYTAFVQSRHFWWAD